MLPGACLDANLVTALVDAQVSEPERARIEAHVAACAACRRLVSGAMASLTAPLEGASEAEPATSETRESRALERGSRVGRYIILAVIGAGSMGVVYSAYDPDLDRRVAIKIVLPAGATGPVASSRLWQEAQAMARLVHPNVIAVHDVGLVDGQVFIAMDLIEGGSLARWLEEGPRSWRQILTVFLAAGRGLAAAHAAGLVHRDFKPENVLVDAQGVARVTDFGLARPAEVREAPLAAGSLPPGDTRLTRTGDLAGTPAYLAPERFTGEPADARSDQFSFCVALWQALYDERPFPAQGLDELIARVVGDEGPARPRHERARRVPARLHRILLRGLLRQPDQRYPSMEALLADLAREPARRGAALAVGAVVVVAGAAWAYQARTSQRDWCGGMETAFGDTWDGPHREATRAAFARAAGARGTPSFARVDRTLSGWREDWIAQRVDACQASHVRHDQSDELLDLRVACLDDELRVTAAFVRLLPAADATLVDRAVETVERLPDVRTCAKRELLMARREPPPSPAQREAVKQAEADLAAGTALKLIGDLPKANPLARRAVDAAQALGRTRLTARALLLLASVPEDTDTTPAGLVRATAAALEARDDESLADAFTATARWQGLRGNLEQVEAAAALGRAAIARMGGDDVRESERLLELARAYERYGADLDRAAHYGEEARRTLVAAGHGDDVRVIYIEEALAMNAYWQARYQDAHVRFGQVADALERVRGPDHPEVLQTRTNQAEMLIDLGRPAEALPLLSALADRLPPEKGYGRLVLIARARALRALGRFPEALVEDRPDLESCRSARNPACVPEALLAVGEDLLGMRLPAEARPLLEEAVTALPGTSSAPVVVAKIKLALARTLPPADRARAEQLAAEARAAITPWADRYGGPYARLRDDLDTWRGR